MRIIRLNLCVNKLAQLDDQSYALMSAHSKEKVEMLRSGSDFTLCWHGLCYVITTFLVRNFVF